MQVEIYSDVVCPWCYIGERRFAKALASFPARDEVRVVFRPYQLDPDAPTAPSPLIESLRRKFGANVRPMLARVSEAATGEGIEIDWDRAVAVNTLAGHRLLRVAEREYGPDIQRALAARLFDAHFARGGNVADAALLADLAAAVGMDRERVQRFLESDEDVDETREEIAQARRLGIRAVPSFVFDGQYLVEGGQPPETFAAVLEEAASRSATQGAQA